MIISYWDDKPHTMTKEQLEFFDKYSKYYVNKIITQCSRNDVGLYSVEIETFNRCNNDCSFCPVNKKNDPRIPHKMTKELFEKIINELADINYCGILSFFSNNEPLLDKRITDFIAYAREKLPNAFLHLFSNGILLTQEIFDKLVQSLDLFIIDNYSDDFKILNNIQKIIDANHSEYKCKVRLWVRLKQQILTNRGSIAPNKENDYSFTSSCILPFFQMIVRPDGKLSMCCNDAWGEYTLGDLNTENITQAWNNHNYQEVRKIFLEDKRGNIKKCATCDTLGPQHNFYPEYFSAYYNNAFLEMIINQLKKRKNIVILGRNSTSIKISRLLNVSQIPFSIIDKYEKEYISQEDFIVIPKIDWDLIFKFGINNFGKSYFVYVHDENRFPPFGTVGTTQGNETIENSFVKFIESQQQNNLIIFGASTYSFELINKYHLKVKFFIDNDQKKQGNSIYKYEVFPVSKVIDNDYYVMIVAQHYDEMEKQLLSLGINKNRIINGNLVSLFSN